MTIRPRIDLRALPTASEEAPASCIGDEASRPARPCRERKANRARESSPGRPPQAGRLAPGDWKSYQGRWGLRAPVLTGPLPGLNRAFGARSITCYTRSRGRARPPAFSAQLRLTIIG